MKRITLSVALAIFGLACCFAQSEGNSTLWGVRAAVDYNFPSKWHYDGGSVKMYSPGYGFTLGGVCNLYLGKGFYLEPGVSFFYDTYSFHDLVISDEPGGQLAVSPGLYKLGVRVPVVAGYTFDFSDQFSMCAYTGPEFSYAFGGKVKYDKNYSGISDELFGEFQRRADVAWKVGIGFPYKSFMVSVDVALGITDNLKSKMRAHDNRLSVAFTYYL